MWTEETTHNGEITRDAGAGGSGGSGGDNSGGGDGHRGGGGGGIGGVANTPSGAAHAKDEGGVDDDVVLYGNSENADDAFDIVAAVLENYDAQNTFSKNKQTTSGDDKDVLDHSLQQLATPVRWSDSAAAASPSSASSPTRGYLDPAPTPFDDSMFAMPAFSAYAGDGFASSPSLNRPRNDGGGGGAVAANREEDEGDATMTTYVHKHQHTFNTTKIHLGAVLGQLLPASARSW
jgi:hypothetical protein